MKDKIENFTISFTEIFKVGKKEKSQKVKIELDSDEAIAFLLSLVKFDKDWENNKRTTWGIVINSLICKLESQMCWDFLDDENTKKAEQKLYDKRWKEFDEEQKQQVQFLSSDASFHDSKIIDIYTKKTNDSLYIKIDGSGAMGKLPDNYTLELCGAKVLNKNTFNIKHEKFSNWIKNINLIQVENFDLLKGKFLSGNDVFYLDGKIILVLVGFESQALAVEFEYYNLTEN